MNIKLHTTDHNGQFIFEVTFDDNPLKIVWVNVIHDSVRQFVKEPDATIEDLLSDHLDVIMKEVRDCVEQDLVFTYLNHEWWTHVRRQDLNVESFLFRDGNMECVLSRSGICEDSKYLLCLPYEPFKAALHSAVVNKTNKEVMDHILYAFKRKQFVII